MSSTPPPSGASSAPEGEAFTIKHIALDAIRGDDKIIVLLGPTGVGKSNFIEQLANTKLDISSFGYERGTNDFTLYRVFNHPTWNDRIVIADTPGFQDASISEYGAIKAIRQWIESSNAPRLHTLFYVDRINTPFKGCDKPCWDLFRRICGDSEASRACLMTTAWDEVGPWEGRSEESTKRAQLAAENKRKKLRTEWEGRLGKGLRCFEFQNTAASAKQILEAALVSASAHAYPNSFLLENMKASLKKQPVKTPIFHLLAERFKEVTLRLSSLEDTVHAPLPDHILSVERLKLQRLRSDMFTLRGEMLEFPEGWWILTKSFFLNLPSVMASTMKITFSAQRPSPQLPINKPSPDDDPIGENTPNTPHAPIATIPDSSDSTSIIVTPNTGNQTNPDAPETTPHPDTDRNEQLPTSNRLVDIMQWCINRREGKVGMGHDIVLIVMGPTGVGKTSFINSCKAFANQSLPDVAFHELEPSSRMEDVEVHTIHFPEAGGKLVLVDTPGFDDSNRSNADILIEIASYLEDSYRQGGLLSGIIYLHRITDIRFDTGAATALNIFRKLYGDDHGYNNLALVTTMWNEIRPELKRKYEDKEKELVAVGWRMFFQREDPALLARYDITEDDAGQTSVQNIIAGLLRTSRGRQLKTKLQKELVDDNIALPRTVAGRAAFSPTETAKYYFKTI